MHQHKPIRVDTGTDRRYNGQARLTSWRNPVTDRESDAQW